MHGGIPKIIATLRQATDHRHRRVEATPLAASVMSRDLTLETYGRLLFETHRIVAPAETWVSAHGAKLEGLPGSQAWSRIGALEADLAQLDLEPPAPKDSLTTGLPETAGGVFGVLYVLEGSALGGHVIAKQVTSHLGEIAEGCLRFHSGDGTPASARFEGLCRLARSATVTRSFESDAVAAANVIFDGFIRTFAQSDMLGI